MVATILQLLDVQCPTTIGWVEINNEIFNQIFYAIDITALNHMLSHSLFLDSIFSVVFLRDSH